MRKILALAMIIFLSATSVFAEGGTDTDMKEIVASMETASDGNFHVNKRQEGPGVEAEYWLTSNDVSCEDFILQMRQMINGTSLRNHSYCEMGTTYFVNYTNEEKTNGIWTIEGSRIQNLIDNEMWLQGWLDANMQNMVSDGMSRDEVISTAYSWIITVADYAEDMTDWKYQSALPIIQEGKGVCTSYCLAFRAILEYVPFNKNWVVDFESGTNHIQVAIIHTTEAFDSGWRHAFNAIQGLDGVWRFYDLTAIETNGFHMCGVDWATVRFRCPQSSDESYIWYY